MKEQIEGILREYWNDEANDFMPSTGFAIDKAIDSILALGLDNHWVEYGCSKPILEGYYTVWNAKKSCLEIQYFNDTAKIFLNNDADVIAFKPTPIEPFKPKNKYVQLLEIIQNQVEDISTKEEYDLFLELKAKIENGDLK